MLWLALVLAAHLNASDRTDVVHLKNGDKLTGEIRLVANGILQFKTDYGSGRFDIYWDQIERIETNKVIAVELSDGMRQRGQMETKPSDEMVIKDREGNELVFDLADVAWMHEGTPGFLGHFDGSLSVGYSLTKSNNTQQFTLSGDLLYNADKYSVSSGLSMLFSSQTDTTPTQRYQGDLSYKHLLGARWYALGGFDALHSDELELDLRTTLGGGIGRYLKRNYNYDFSVAGGAVWDWENYSDPGIPDQNTPEAIASAQFNAYNLIGDNLNLTNEIKFFKSMTDASRTRIDLSSEVRWSLPRHLFFNIQLQDNFDSSPTGTAPKNDYLFSTGFGWQP
jgi:putative salt-induced outer membrane protein YdiY